MSPQQEAAQMFVAEQAAEVRTLDNLTTHNAPAGLTFIDDLDQLLGKAKSLYAEGKLDEAEALIKQFKQQPDLAKDRQRYFEMSRLDIMIDIAQGDLTFAKVEKLKTQKESLKDNGSRAEIGYFTGMFEKQQRRLDEAAKAWKSAVKHASSGEAEFAGESLFELVKYFQLKKKEDKVVDCYKKMLSIGKHKRVDSVVDSLFTITDDRRREKQRARALEIYGFIKSSSSTGLSQSDKEMATLKWADTRLEMAVFDEYNWSEMGLDNFLGEFDKTKTHIFGKKQDQFERNYAKPYVAIMRKKTSEHVSAAIEKLCKAYLIAEEVHVAGKFIDNILKEKSLVNKISENDRIQIDGYRWLANHEQITWALMDEDFHRLRFSDEDYKSRTRIILNAVERKKHNVLNEKSVFAANHKLIMQQTPMDQYYDAMPDFQMSYMFRGITKKNWLYQVQPNFDFYLGGFKEGWFNLNIRSALSYSIKGVPLAIGVSMWEPSLNKRGFDIKVKDRWYEMGFNGKLDVDDADSDVKTNILNQTGLLFPSNSCGCAIADGVLGPNRQAFAGIGLNHKLFSYFLHKRENALVRGFDSRDIALLSEMVQFYEESGFGRNLDLSEVDRDHVDWALNRGEFPDNFTVSGVRSLYNSVGLAARFVPGIILGAEYGTQKTSFRDRLKQTVGKTEYNFSSIYYDQRLGADKTEDILTLHGRLDFQTGNWKFFAGGSLTSVLDKNVSYGILEAWMTKTSSAHWSSHDYDGCTDPKIERELTDQQKMLAEAFMDHTGHSRHKGGIYLGFENTNNSLVLGWGVTLKYDNIAGNDVYRAEVSIASKLDGLTRTLLDLLPINRVDRR